MVGTPDFNSLVTLIANDNWLEFTVRYLVPYDNRRGIKDKLFTQMVDELQKTNGKVQFASMTIEITNFPKVAVDIEK